jgi:hypothetical protein
MPKWEVSLTFQAPRVTRTVEGEDWSEAHANAHELAEKLAAEQGPDVVGHAEIMRQLGEPWVRAFGGGIWYDMHGPGDVICFERSTGNVFTAEDVQLLRDRLEATGLKVKDSWNGAGCNQVSYRCSGREPKDAKFTKAQVKAILAPREVAHDQPA